MLTPEQLEKRHPSTRHIMEFFDYGHLPDPDLKKVSAYFWEIAGIMVEILDDGDELIAGLRKLLESKDCCVRQAYHDKKHGRGKVNA